MLLISPLRLLPLAPAVTVSLAQQKLLDIMSFEFGHMQMKINKYLDGDISFCNFSHVEANCWNHILTELS